MRRCLVVVFAAALGGIGCTGETLGTRSLPAFVTVRCPDDVEVQFLVPHSCGYLSVLEDRDHPTGPIVRLLVVEVPPPEPTDAEPVIILGDDIGAPPNYGRHQGEAQRLHRTVYVLDQRGTGHSQPSLACPEVDRLSTARASAFDHPRLLLGGFLEAVRACVSRLRSANIDVSSFGLRSMAADVEDLRRVLGITSWDVASYGSYSLLAFDVMKEFPASVRAGYLVSPQFGELDQPTRLMHGTAVVLSDLFRACRGSPSCRTRFGDLRDQWLIAIDRLDDRPLLEHVRHVGGGDVLIDGALFVRAVAAMLAEDLAVQQQLPAIINGAARRHISADVASAITNEGVVCVGYRYGCSARFSLGAYLNAFCADGEAVARSVEVDPLAAKIGVKRAFEADPYPRACSVWPMHEASSAARPRRIETPILLVSGRVDPFTPASDVQHLAAQLPHGFSVIVPGQNHDVFGPNCAPAIRDAWIDDPSSQPPHRPCLAASRSASV